MNHILNLEHTPEFGRCRDQGGKSILHQAAYFNQFDIVKRLLDTNKELSDVRDDEGYTALHLAVLNGDARVTGCLLEKYVWQSFPVNAKEGRDGN